MVAFVVLLVAWSATSAFAAEGSGGEREQYVAEVEPICKQNVLANRRIFAGAREDVKNGKLKLASTHFFRAATAFAKTIGELAAVPQPAADGAKLSEWLAILRTEKSIILKIATALKAEKKPQAQSYSVDLNRNSNKANNTVLSFGFNYCRIEPSRFGG
jgi:hypothetical protein